MGDKNGIRLDGESVNFKNKSRQVEMSRNRFSRGGKLDAGLQDRQYCEP